ncbi:MAG: agmatine deiminase family protein [Mariprofundaceae bacterium]|nr:agmatine deiminase family protein [Mariprofundaceae bacterium]
MQSNVRLPAEWEPQQGIMLAWPHEKTDWIHQLTQARHCVATICTAIDLYEQVYLLHDPRDSSPRDYLQQPHTHNIQLIPCHFNDTWIRDYGPIAIDRHHQVHLLNFQFNAWGEKFSFELDNHVNQYLDQHGFFKASMTSLPFVLEGGSIESNGLDTLMTTQQCLQQRHPQQSLNAIQTQLMQFFGMQHIIMLKHGHLMGDDTDAHIDTLARFFSPTGIVYMHCDDKNDPHYQDLQAMQKELRALRTPIGKTYELQALPWPKAILNKSGQRLAASYANFLIINDAVLLPSYGLTTDVQAQQVLASCFPNRRIVMIACETLIEQGGSLHCMTMQFPKGLIA